MVGLENKLLEAPKPQSETRRAAISLREEFSKLTDSKDQAAFLEKEASGLSFTAYNEATELSRELLDKMKEGGGLSSVIDRAWNAVQSRGDELYGPKNEWIKTLHEAWKEKREISDTEVAEMIEGLRGEIEVAYLLDDKEDLIRSSINLFRVEVDKLRGESLEGPSATGPEGEQIEVEVMPEGWQPSEEEQGERPAPAAEGGEEGPPGEPPESELPGGDEEESEEEREQDPVDELGLDLTIKPLRDTLRKYAHLRPEEIQGVTLAKDLERVVGVQPRREGDSEQIERAKGFLRDRLRAFRKRQEGISPFKSIWERFKDYAKINDFEWGESLEGDKDRFEAWLRGWALEHLSTVIEDNPQNHIVGLEQVAAVLSPRDVMETRLRSLLDEFPREYKDIADKIAREVRVISTIHNRNRLYQTQRADLAKLAETLAAMPEYGGGTGQTFKLDGENWETLAEMGPVKEGEIPFSKMLRDALKVYLGMDRERNDGSLTRGDLEKLGLSTEALDVYLESLTREDPDWQVEYEERNILVRNPFPVQTRGKERELRETRKRITLLAGNGNEEMGTLAEILAFDMAEVGFVGADLDIGWSAMEASVKVVHTGNYRRKYVKKAQEAGNPLTVPFFWKLCNTYPDAVKMDGRSLKEWILDPTVESMSDIPWSSFPAEMDDKFYANKFNWAAKVFGFLLEGTTVPWPTVGLGGLEFRGVQVDPKHRTRLREMYKYIGYWASSVDLDLLKSQIDPFRENSLISWGCHWLKEEEAFGEPFSKEDFRLLVKNEAMRQMVEAELTMHGRLNPATNLWKALMGEVGEARITIHDQRLIRQLLTTTQFLQAFATEGTIFEGVEPIPIWDTQEVDDLLKRTGITTPQATFVNFQDVAAEVSEIMNVRRRGGARRF